MFNIMNVLEEKEGEWRGEVIFKELPIIECVMIINSIIFFLSDNLCFLLNYRFFL